MRRILAGVCLFTILVTTISIGGCSNGIPVNGTVRTVEIQRGDLQITVSSDGNLVMPESFDLKFGAPGNVEEVYVEVYRDSNGDFCIDYI